MERTIRIELPHCSYDVQIAPGAISRAGALLKETAPHAKAAVLADEAVFALHGESLRHSLDSSGWMTVCHTFPSGEGQKTIETVSALYQVLIEAGLERRSPVCAFGGGVAGDLVGFAAATYLRGVPYIQVPTTLLAMVDASVGGKTAYNHPLGKNLIGAFHQPRLVLIDPDVLRTLPARELRCGLAECVKHGMIGDEALFRWTEDHIQAVLQLDSGALVELIARNVEFKAGIVLQDEKEQGVRAVLNLGHTFAHAIEATAGYGRILHGEAVAIGMCAAARLSEDLNRLDSQDRQRLEALLERIGLPTAAELPETAVLLEAMARDKKIQNGSVRLIVPEAVGRCSIEASIPSDRIAAAWQAVRS